MTTKLIDHEYTDEIVCPHCGHEYNDHQGLPKDGDIECYECDKYFGFQTNNIVTYSTWVKDKR